MRRTTIAVDDGTMAKVKQMVRTMGITQAEVWRIAVSSIEGLDLAELLSHDIAKRQLLAEEIFELMEKMRMKVAEMA